MWCVQMGGEEGSLLQGIMLHRCMGHLDLIVPTIPHAHGVQTDDVEATPVVNHQMVKFRQTLLSQSSICHDVRRWTMRRPPLSWSTTWRGICTWEGGIRAWGWVQPIWLRAWSDPQPQVLILLCPFLLCFVSH